MAKPLPDRVRSVEMAQADLWQPPGKLRQAGSWAGDHDVLPTSVDQIKVQQRQEETLTCWAPLDNFIKFEI